MVQASNLTLRTARSGGGGKPHNIYKTATPAATSAATPDTGGG